MPELPEVETTRRGIEGPLLDARIAGMVLRRRDLRWPIPEDLPSRVGGRRIQAVRRRAKYLLIDLDGSGGSLLLHLGMSGALRVLPEDEPARVHDHVDLCLEGGRVLRFNDPRRFGCCLWQAPGETHPLLADLGPEPLEPGFDGEYLWRLSRGRRAPVKAFLMDQATVVGVGNIYAAEALFAAGIHPLRAAGRVSLSRYQRLAEAVRGILTRAIEAGGTTLRDFLKPDGAPGYFEQALAVYGREGLPCPVCATALRGSRLGNRATAYCPRCQR